MKIKKHFIIITKHKWEVFKACCKAGIIWRGIKHDISKYNPIEFFEYAKYYNGEMSPVDKCKQINGYCESWQHHKGHNSHHWEYWIDYQNGKLIPTKIPYKDLLELICDWIGAGKVYEKEKWNFTKPYDYFSKKRNMFILHPETEKCLCQILLNFSKRGFEVLKNLKNIYK